ncbi:protein VASCULAR ASSOCIATED DEATH 1, chloroplastic isoform X2 [Euphorbia lathyris]|uniref:protein VASCULAR ASSOCIATED DEATH 1, chloroplastic isoform X2 n=1 Tax=Euphorbia lathyris TaxID=212925 RepID=UPI0033141D79
MAVTTETAESVSSLPMAPSASKSVSDFASEPSSPARISWAADTPDRSDHSNSSPASNSDSQSFAALKSEEYRQLFRLPPEEALVQDFNCAFQESILLQGHMYLFTHYLCFYSNIFGFETKKVIPFIEITSVKRAKTAGIFPNAIEILAGGKKYFFASFLSRDEAFKLINDGWVQHGDGAKAMAEQQVSIFKEDHELEPNDRDKGASPSNDYEVLVSPLHFVENDGFSDVVTELQGDIEMDVEQVGCIEPLSTSRTCVWKEENDDAPQIQKSYTRVGETKFAVKVEEFFNLFFSDDAIDFMNSFHSRSGDKEFRCSSWIPEENLVHTRKVSFQHPIKIYFGAKFGSCQEVQKFRVYRNSHLVIETSQEISDVPYGDYFRVEGLWDVVKGGDETNEGCILRIFVDVSFSKRTVFKGRILQSTVEECREAYAIWIEMAHELLKQKNLEKQEDPATSMTENAVCPESDQKICDSSETSNRSNDSRVMKQISGGVSDRAGNVMQGNFLSTAWLKPLLRECAAKFSTFLRTQSQVSLILVVAFVVIFLMQVSIIVLLNRPQKVIMAPAGEYYRGSSIGERSAESLAWLESRAHHLKDEIFMVERQLQRLHREHSWLKEQVKDLNHFTNHK